MKLPETKPDERRVIEARLSVPVVPEVDSTRNAQSRVIQSGRSARSDVLSGVEKRRSDGSLPVAMVQLSPRRLSPV